jgi:hypothetical protein
LPLNKISGGRKFHEFLALQNLSKSFTERCGAMLWKRAGNSMNFRPFEIQLSPLQNVVVERSVKGPEILVWQNFQGLEIP